MVTKPKAEKRALEPAMKPELWALDRIKPYPGNPRTHPPAQVALLAELLKKRGVDQPIVVDEAGIILKGHGRRMAAELAGLAKFPVVIRRGLSDVEKRALRIEDNQVALLSEWDAVLIRGEITELKQVDYPLLTLGFSDLDLRQFDQPVEGGPDPDVESPLPKHPVARGGDLWHLGKHRLLCGDATKAGDVERALDGKHSVLMVTDPPYGVEYDPSWRADANKWKGSKVKIGAKAMGTVSNDHLADWRKAWRLFKGDVAYVWHGGLRSVEQAQSLEASDFLIRNQIIWNKGRFVISRGDYHWQHEACWYAVRKGKNGRWTGSRTESTVWDIAKPQASETGHGTQKPVECMKRPIENNTRRGEYVYDPFVGSGTTIIAAEMTGRICLAIDQDPVYVHVAIERWQKFTGKVATLDGAPFAKVAAARKSGKPTGAKNAKGHSSVALRRPKPMAAAGDGPTVAK